MVRDAASPQDPSLCLFTYDDATVQYYIQTKGRTGFGAGMIVPYVIIFAIMITAYLRTFAAVVRDPGLVPLVNGQDDDTNEKQPPPPPPPRRRRRRGQEPDVETQPWTPMDMNPDSPGLENFYSKDVFVCEADGRPKWCSGCRQWKPDRAHHSSELGRCVYKMDHLCPWVGGMVSETCELGRTKCATTYMLTISSIQLLCPVHLLLRFVLCINARTYRIHIKAAIWGTSKP